MNPQIKVIEDEEILKFTLSGVDVSLANAVRRIILNDIPTVVFRTETYQDNQCKIAINTSRLHNEIIKQRLSCIPIHSTDHAILPGKYIMELDVTNAEDHIIFVTTEDFRIKNKENGNFLTKEETVKIFPPDKKTGYFIDFIRLRPAVGDIPAEQIKLSCEFSVASAHTNSMFNVVSKCAYAYTPDAAAGSKAWDAIERKMAAEGATEKEMEFSKKNFMLLDAQRHFEKDSFDFVVRSVGVYNNIDIYKIACRMMELRLQVVIDAIESDVIRIEISDTTMDNCYDVILEHEDYTVGKPIEYYLYEHFYNGKKTLSFCGFKKTHPHNDYSTIRLAYEAPVDKHMIRGDMKEACVELQKVFISMGKMM
jgi:DNA-directed RNA polymerase alpha subunit